MMKLKLILLSLLCTTLILKAEKPPNILLIMADDLGWYDVHFNGNEHLDTPNLDRFVKQGMVFPHGYAAAPVCTPTRAAMMTGMSPARLAITNHAPGFKDGMVPEGRTQAGAEKLTYLPLEAETLAERLKNEVGYATGFVGKWHLSHRKGENKAGEKYELGLRPKSQGFDLNIGGYDRGGPPTYFAPYRIPTLKEGPKGEYLPDRLATECIDFIKKKKNEKIKKTEKTEKIEKAPVGGGGHGTQKKLIAGKYNAYFGGMPDAAGTAVIKSTGPGTYTITTATGPSDAKTTAISYDGGDFRDEYSRVFKQDDENIMVYKTRNGKKRLIARLKPVKETRSFSRYF